MQRRNLKDERGCRFHIAAAALEGLAGGLGEVELLPLYARYKQATMGPAAAHPDNQPARFRIGLRLSSMPISN